MGEVNQVVDHLKLEYEGVFNIRDMFRMFTRWYSESPYEKGGDYASEQHTGNGRYLEYFYFPWKKQTDYVRHYMKIRLLLYDVKKVDIMIGGKKKKMDHGRVLMYIDGFVEYDYEVRWEHGPLLQFIRTIFNKFLFKRYSRFFEKIMIDDTHNLYEMFERFFNMYKSYKPVKSMPHWYY